MSRRLVETEASYIKHVKDNLLEFYKKLPVSTDMFHMQIKKCVELFWKYETIQDGIQSFYQAWVTKYVSDPDALSMIQSEVIPLLKNAKADGQYTSFQGPFKTLYEYIKSWFLETTRETGEPDVSHYEEDAVTALTDRVTVLEKTVTANRNENERKMKALLKELKDHSKEIAVLNLSEEDYAQGMKYIQLMFKALLEIKDPRRIDLQPVSEFEAYSNLGFTRLLQAMHIGIDDGEVFGVFANAVKKNATKDACRGWMRVLQRDASTIFLLIKRLRPILTTQEDEIMNNVEKQIHAFMYLFHISY